MTEAWKQKPTPDWLVGRWEEIFNEIDRLRTARQTGRYLHRPVSVNQMKRIRNILDLEIETARMENEA